MKEEERHTIGNCRAWQASKIFLRKDLSFAISVGRTTVVLCVSTVSISSFFYFLVGVTKVPPLQG
jgi:hypothetical protein